MNGLDHAAHHHRERAREVAAEEQLAGARPHEVPEQRRAEHPAREGAAGVEERDRQRADFEREDLAHREVRRAGGRRRDEEDRRSTPPPA